MYEPLITIHVQCLATPSCPDTDTSAKSPNRLTLTLRTLHHCVLPGDDDSEDQNEEKAHVRLQDFYCMGRGLLLYIIWITTGEGE